jgi:hypothetical protein
VLREHALIESAVSSNRIKGVEADQSRVGTLIFGRPALRDRDEEEVRGYRDAPRLVHETGMGLPISDATVKRLHKLCRGEIRDAGAYKERDVDIIQTFVDGRSRVGFKTVSADKTPAAMAELFTLWDRGLREKWAPPFVFERRVGQLKSSRGEKTAMVLAAVDRQTATFRMADLQAECSGVGVDLIRLVLDRLRSEGKVRCLGTGRSARWAKTGN